tara:strand:+ start:11422 stop:12195 length:774 start_codon:yes stop_codon:yes gene_type:complete
MKFSVLGIDTSRSLSPRLHSFVYKLLELDHCYNFIESSSIDAKVLMRYDGVNITNPFKRKIITYLKNIDDISTRTQSVNCIKKKNDILCGFNTDYYGFYKSLKINNINLKNRSIAVLGAGGVAASVCAYLQDNNYSFKVLNRTKSNSITLKDILKLTDNNIYQRSDKATFDVAINCLSSNIDISKFLKLQNVDIKNINEIIDINYNSTISYAGIQADIINSGLDMLIFQALKSIEIWIDKDISQIVDYQTIKNHINK